MQIHRSPPCHEETMQGNMDGPCWLHPLRVVGDAIVLTYIKSCKVKVKHIRFPLRLGQVAQRAAVNEERGSVSMFAAIVKALGLL